MAHAQGGEEMIKSANDDCRIHHLLTRDIALLCIGCGSARNRIGDLKIVDLDQAHSLLAVRAAHDGSVGASRQVQNRG